jgi:predicted outer membrane protein
MAQGTGNQPILRLRISPQALDKSQNKDVKAFAEEMVRDHEAVNKQALALLDKLKVKPEGNGTSKSLADAASKKREELSKLSGDAFDMAYAENEVTYHQTVNGALEKTLIPRRPERRACCKLVLSSSRSMKSTPRTS